MAHPQMFEDDDPVLARLREVVVRLPEVHERISHGRPHFRAGEKGTGFAVYGGGVKVRPGVHDPHEQSVLFRPDPAEAGALDADPRFWAPAYYGPSGWRGLDLGLDHTDWEEVAELLDASYRQVATRRLLTLLNGSSDQDR